MSENLRPARVASPGAILRRELDARGWTQKELAEIMRRPTQAISEIIAGEKRITEETALELASALGTSAEFWLNLEANFRLRKAQTKEQASRSDVIQRKARLYELVPLGDIRKRGWIRETSSLDEMEADVCALLGISSPREAPRFAASFRYSEARVPHSSAQVAWVKRVEQVALERASGRFDRDTLRAAIPKLLQHATGPDAAPQALETLARLGVGVAVVRHLPKTFVDGVAFVRDDGRPVLGLSLRYDRLDNFWFTLLHEVAHLVAGHKAAHLDDLKTPSTSPDECEANEMAQEWLVPRRAYASFLAATAQISAKAVQAFAAEIGRHPAIVVGRLQFEKRVPYSFFKPLIPKVGAVLEASGWLDG